MAHESIKRVLQYPEIYRYLRSGVTSLDELLKLIRKGGSTGGQVKRRKEFINEAHPYISVDDDEITYMMEDLRGDLKAMIREFCLDEELEQNDQQSARIRELEAIVEEQDGLIHELRDQVKEMEMDAIKRQMHEKVLVAGSIEVGPKKKTNEDLFLDNPQNLLDAEKLVTIYGGQLDSLYEEIPTDEKQEMTEEAYKRYEPGQAERYEQKYEPGKELTLDNYRSRIMKRLGTKSFFRKRLKDVKTVKEFEKEHGKVFPDNTKLLYNPEDNTTPRKQVRNRILKNRFETLNNVIQSDEFTNQEKLMLFAVNGNFQHRNMEKYLRYAARYCINADFLIYLLQGDNPNVCDNYTNMVGFLQQFIDPSEFRMKLDLARELIEGKWYIVADYDGKPTKFQLVPIDEFNELRQKVGLPISEFKYMDNTDPETESDCIGTDAGQGTELAASEITRTAEKDSYDLPDDGFEMDFYDDDFELPF